MPTAKGPVGRGKMRTLSARTREEAPHDGHRYGAEGD